MIEFVLDTKFIVPFLSTVGASLTIIILQSIHRGDIERKKKLYTIAYMTAAALRLFQSALILKKHTIIPHIKAAKQIIEGDQDLLNTAFLLDDFDVFTGNAIEFNTLPEDCKVLIGYDDIDLLHSYEALVGISKDKSTGSNFNSFVKLNLKSKLAFEEKRVEEQVDILNTYWDYLDKLKHEEDRLVAFIVYIFLPRALKYTNKIEFIFCSKKNTVELTKKFDAIREKYKDIIPGSDFFEQSVNGGIQRIVNSGK